MKKKWMIAALALIGCLGIFLYLSLDKTDEKEAPFNFSMAYHVGGTDFVSTFDGVLTHYTQQGPVSKAFDFTQEDLDTIETRIKDLGLMEDDFGPIGDPYIFISPMSKYDLTIELDGQTKNFQWTGGHLYSLKEDEEKTAEEKKNDAALKRLMDLHDLILNLIEDYDVYKQMPPHMEGYQ